MYWRTILSFFLKTHESPTAFSSLVSKEACTLSMHMLHHITKRIQLISLELTLKMRSLEQGGSVQMFYLVRTHIPSSGLVMIYQATQRYTATCWALKPPVWMTCRSVSVFGHDCYTRYSYNTPYFCPDDGRDANIPGVSSCMSACVIDLCLETKAI